MKRALIITLSALLLSTVINPAKAEYDLDLPLAGHQASEDEVFLPSIFIWNVAEPSESSQDSASETGEPIACEEDELDEFDYSMTGDIITLFGDDESAEPLFDYAKYSEFSNAIGLKDDNDEFVLNLSKPQKFTTLRAANSKLQQTQFVKNVYARSSDIAYNIAPTTATAVVKDGAFSIGTSYDESVDNSDLGFTTSFFTKYDNKYFSLSSAYKKNSGVAYSNVIDKFSFTPELKFNEYISIKDIMTSDITRNRKENELVLSLKPTKEDRIRFELGAGQTYDEHNSLMRSKVKFSTLLKW